MASIYLSFMRTLHQSPALTSMLVLTSQWQVGTAVAALALGGVAAGFLVWRMVMRKKHPKKKPQLQETGNTGARKELRRKRPDPHTGYCVGTPGMNTFAENKAVLEAFFLVAIVKDKVGPVASRRESPRTISTMLRSESTSSVGPRRKQPRWCPRPDPLSTSSLAVLSDMVLLSECVTGKKSCCPLHQALMVH